MSTTFGQTRSQIRAFPALRSAGFGTFSLAGPADLLLAHALGLGLHTTSLIVFKGALNAPGTKLMPDKVPHGFAFPCDGPGRGGTCDISAWDSIYLAAFWMLNTVAWSEFTFHWKHLGTWNGSYIQFDLSSSSLNGWFRDYLWFNSAGLIRGYETTCSFDLAVLAWAFLLGHLIWATGFMYLISWRGYWEELIDSLIIMQDTSPILPDLWASSVVTPVGVSILQARFTGLVHFSAGLTLTYAAFIFAATS